MKQPSWKTCTEEELWKYIGYHLASHNIESILVGGAVAAVYSKGAYRSGDLDFIAKTFFKERIPAIMKDMGFQFINGHFKHPECHHLFVEFVQGPVAIGEDQNITPAERKVNGKTIKILSPTDCIKDRLANFMYFHARECLDQAILVAQSQPFSETQVKTWCSDEGYPEVFDEFICRLHNTKK